MSISKQAGARALALHGCPLSEREYLGRSGLDGDAAARSREAARAAAATLAGDEDERGEEDEDDGPFRRRE